MRFSAIASLEVTLFTGNSHTLCGARRLDRHVDTAVARLCIGHGLVVRLCRPLLLDDFRLSEGLWVAHQNVLLGLDSDGVKFAQVVAADTRASCATVAIVCEAFTVELQALRFPTIARFVGGR